MGSSSSADSPERTASYEQHRPHTPVDRFGVWLSARALKRHVPTFAGKSVGDFGCGYHATLRSLGASRGRARRARRRRSRGGSQDRRAVTAIEGTCPTRFASFPTARSTSCSASRSSSTSGIRSRRSSSCGAFVASGGVCLVNVPSWRGKRFLELSAFRLGLSPAEEMDDHKALLRPARSLAAARSGRVPPARDLLLPAQVRPEHVRRLPGGR